MRLSWLFRLAFLALAFALSGCATVDSEQAGYCERVARTVFSDGQVLSLASAPDPDEPDGVLSKMRLRGAAGDIAEHDVACAFEGGRLSAGRLTLRRVTLDGILLGPVRMALLLIALDEGGSSDNTAWLGETAPAPGKGTLALPFGMAGAYFLQQLINAITYGCIVTPIAIGFTLVYAIVGAINFAFGELYMIGAIIAVAALALLWAVGLTSPALGLLLALLVVMLLTAGYGWATERLVFRPLRGSGRLMPLVAAIGLSIVLQNYVFVAQGARDFWLPPMGGPSIVLGEGGGFGVYVNPMQALVAAATLALIGGCGWLLAYTPFGRAHRASSQDILMAALVGINVDRVIAGSFALGGALAGAGGVMVASYYGGVNFVMGFVMGFKALTAAIVGGMGSFRGAILGGFIVAFVETFWAGYLQSEYKEVAVFSLLILLLVFRPQGILGRR
jgi:branched-chain amino acid transport system permease protein